MSTGIKTSEAAGRVLSFNSPRAAATDGSSDGFRMSQTVVAMNPTMHTDSDVAPKARLNLAMCAAKYVGTYWQKYRRLGTHLHRQLCLSLHLDLNLYLNLNLNPSLYGALL